MLVLYSKAIAMLLQMDYYCCLGVLASDFISHLAKEQAYN